MTPPSEAAPSSALREVLGVYALVWVATFALSQTAPVPVLGDHRGELVGLLFLAVAMTLGTRFGLERAGLTLGGLMLPATAPTPFEEATRPLSRHDVPDHAQPDGEPPHEADSPRPPRHDVLGLLDLAHGVRTALPSALRETGAALLVALVVFPPFVVGFYFYTEPLRPFAWEGVVGTPAQLLTWAELLLGQLLVVALPEEAFFRGYVQSRLAGAAHATDPRLRAPAVIVGQAVLFALVHLASVFHVVRLAVFFPGLLFGLIRAWRGGIGAALVFHALCNLLSEVLTRGWLS
ncbi:MAG: CPBP family intramembrane glutamic endopeptidase [Polyangiales bacterium]|nr:CPBP family intramembrane metalloprotease [Myxococcales bacterium]MCB9657194.1 CPBP family intramembrane metalloprotease [Sandaracinaceae bacterium]